MCLAWLQQFDRFTKIIINKNFISEVWSVLWKYCRSAPDCNYQLTLLVISLCFNIAFNNVLCCFVIILYTPT